MLLCLLSKCKMNSSVFFLFKTQCTLAFKLALKKLNVSESLEWVAWKLFAMKSLYYQGSKLTERNSPKSLRYLTHKLFTRKLLVNYFSYQFDVLESSCVVMQDLLLKTLNLKLPRKHPSKPFGKSSHDV